MRGLRQPQEVLGRMSGPGPLRVLAGLCLVAALGTAPKAEAKPRLKPYVVLPGDSCWSIAEKFFGDGERYTVIHEHNDLGPMPHVLQPGLRLNLPADVPGPAARVDWVHRRVRARPAWAVDWRGAKPAMPLWQRHRVATGDGSSAVLLFVDRSKLRMRENALVVIYGKQAASAVQAQERAGTEVALERGTLRSGLARMDAAAELTVRTPSASVGLQPGQAQVGVDDKATTRVSVFSGRARVRAQGKEVAVPANHGTTVLKGRRPQRPRRLPPAPPWSGGGAPVAKVVLQDAQATLEASWEPVKGARAYHVELARDEAFQHVEVDAEVPADTHAFRAEGLSAGTRYLRVATVDRGGLEGPCGSGLRLVVVPLTTSRPVLAGEQPGEVEVAGFVRLAVPGGQDEGLALVSGEGETTPLTTPIRLARPGLHELHFVDAQGRPAGAAKVRLLRVRATLTPTSETVPASQGSLGVAATLLDERGRPPALPSLSVATSPAPGAPLTCGPEGRCSARIPLPPQGGPLDLALQWPGGDLARTRVEVQPPAVPPPGAAWEPPPVVGEPLWALPVAALPQQSARPTTLLGLSAALADAPQQGGETPRHLKLLARGSLALADGRVALDAQLPWHNAPLDSDPAGVNELGDVRLAARWLALEMGDVAVAPRLGLRLPTGGFARAVRSLGVEGGLLADWTPSLSWELGAQQTVVADLAEDATWTWTGSYRALWLPWRAFGVGAQLDTVVELSGEHTRRALGAGVGLHLRGARSRVGLVGAAGLNDDARSLLGRFTLGVGGDVAW